MFSMFHYNYWFSNWKIQCIHEKSMSIPSPPPFLSLVNCISTLFSLIKITSHIIVGFWNFDLTYSIFHII